MKTTTTQYFSGNIEMYSANSRESNITPVVVKAEDIRIALAKIIKAAVIRVGTDFGEIEVNPGVVLIYDIHHRLKARIRRPCRTAPEQFMANYLYECEHIKPSEMEIAAQALDTEGSEPCQARM